MKGIRRKAREDALQILYQLDLNQHLTIDTALQHFEALFLKNQTELDPFTKRLVVGVGAHLKELDEKLKNISSHWRPDRMAAVDRNILRLGAFEILFCDDIPATVTLNEMVEIAKEYGAENTPAFVNGVLDQLKLHYPNPSKVQ